MTALGAIVAKSSHAFSGYENQRNIARKWSLAKEYEGNPIYGHTRVHDNMVPRAIRALGTKSFERGACVTEYRLLLKDLWMI